MEGEDTEVGTALYLMPAELKVILQNNNQPSRLRSDILLYTKKEPTYKRHGIRRTVSAPTEAHEGSSKEHAPGQLAMKSSSSRT